jgi:Domain of unknown function DUF11
MRWRRRSRPGLVAAVVLACLAASPAQAQQPPGPDGKGSDLFVTIAARQCPTYESIRANRARNNIQESLRDLGLDSPYVAGEPIDPEIEASTQPACTAIDGWRFTLGKGIGGKVTGPWGSLSIVSSPYATDVTTLPSIPDRDAQGRPLPGTSLTGATTIELTDEQAKLAEASSRLWIQGGMPGDPILAAVPEFAEEFGFGALRCSIDNLNGDNVEWISFPTGSRHVYCYAYYVTPPPTSGTIIVRKEVSEPPQADQTFVFKGNISYTPDQRFSLRVEDGKAASATVYRAETGPDDDPWEVRELVPPGWSLTDLRCTTSGSAVTTDSENAKVSIRLLAGDTVTCTFTDALRPPPGELLISKITTDAAGTFPFAVRPEGGGEAIRASATTTEEGVPTQAVPGPIELDPGTYRVGERLPRAKGGHWRRTAVNCNARRRTRLLRPVEVTISPGRGAACTFENRFVAAGSLGIAKVTRGATGTAGFVISPLSGPARQYVQRATTRAEGVPAPARGDSTLRLPLGRYAIQETGTVVEGDGRWRLLTVSCGGRLYPFGQGQAIVELTPERPRLLCRFTNGFTDGAGPPPAVLPAVPLPPGARADLSITKRALQGSVRVGGVADFELAVRNAGTAAAEQVVVADDPGENGQLVSARPSRGSCDERTPVICRVGRLEPGEQLTVRVRVRAVRPPAIDNLAATGTASPEDGVANSTANARLRVGERRVRGVCAQAARAAC